MKAKIDREIYRKAAFAAVGDDELLGFCVACGEQYDGLLEPDARNVHCDCCGEDEVFGAEEIVIQGL